MNKTENSLGQRIGLLRKQRGLTQEQLGQKIGVTPQAISKWECGGSPDAELLPDIADALMVSITGLFYDVQEEQIPIEQQVTEEMKLLDEKDRLKKAMELYKVLQFAFCDNYIDPEISIYTDSDMLEEQIESTIYHSTVCNEWGIATARLNRGQEYFFIMPTQTQEFGNVLGNVKKYEECFACLGKPHRLSMACFLYSRGKSKFTIQALARLFQLEQKEVETILKELKKFLWIEEAKVELKKKQVTTYGISTNLFFLPMLYAATDCIDASTNYLFMVDDRGWKEKEILFSTKVIEELYKQ